MLGVSTNSRCSNDLTDTTNDPPINRKNITINPKANRGSPSLTHQPEHPQALIQQEQQQLVDHHEHPKNHHNEQLPEPEVRSTFIKPISSTAIPINLMTTGNDNTVLWMRNSIEVTKSSTDNTSCDSTFNRGPDRAQRQDDCRHPIRTIDSTSPSNGKNDGTLGNKE
ncbi:hypothetical protein BDK51DRAFT_32429 [Blyttiomyces helicus]|uniref:Uncharacterized protein n=1 Tax=Blyttiomyces helicus TaxID=388810 RepID=A0A4V1ISR3_9FUNG|nr:hypothetical protein BDK51DRAFT_32429 [Blyttiomyces helicus]|eukprot:RKO94457.1 hypothetical protein BDK51DRAFT_32429 [Blyttiomyces helicus]